jgi:hypothetical protein
MPTPTGVLTGRARPTVEPQTGGGKLDPHGDWQRSGAANPPAQSGRCHVTSAIPLKPGAVNPHKPTDVG